jgi:N-acetylglucosaminyldiphosphoundecaprenol N-acetyl-beta-D-mannosaminyltransferase
MHVPVGPIAVFDGGPEHVRAICMESIRAAHGLRVATANLDFLALAQRHAPLRADLEASHLVVADGAPVVWLGRLGGARRMRRVAGVDLVEALLQDGAAHRVRVALYGSSDETSREAAKQIEQRYPGIDVVCRMCPPFRALSAEERQAERAILREASPELVLVALGCPRQERLIAEYFEAAPQAVWIGIGGTLDFFAGQRRRAPGMVQGAGLEWLVRLGQEPGRLWRRYLLRDLPTLISLLPDSLVNRRKGVSRNRIGRRNGVSDSRKTAPQPSINSSARE